MENLEKFKLSSFETESNVNTTFPLPEQLIEVLGEWLKQVSVKGCQAVAAAAVAAAAVTAAAVAAVKE